MKSERVVADVYEDHKRLIYHTARRFVERYGGDFEEAVSEGNMAFMNAYRLHDSARGKFSTLLVTAMANRLKNWRNDRYKEESHSVVRLDVEDVGGLSMAGSVPDGSHSYDFGDLIKDAKLVMSLVLKAPADLLGAVESKGGHATNWRKALRSYLKGMGWDSQDIEKSFDEIGDVLVLA